MHSRTRRQAVLVLAALLPCGCAGGGDLEIEDAWVRAAPPAAPVLAGYFTLHNPTRGTVTIVGARSAAFARVEMHETVHRDGAAGMRRIARLVVDPGESAVFAPGGAHLMLIEPRAPVAPGETIEIVLELEGAGDLKFTAEVRAAAP